MEGSGCTVKDMKASNWTEFLCGDTIVYFFGFDWGRTGLHRYDMRLFRLRDLYNSEKVPLHRLSFPYLCTSWSQFHSESSEGIAFSNVS